MNLDAVLVSAEQVTAAEHVLEEAKEDLDRPAMRENQRDDLRWNIQQIGRDTQDAVAVHAAGATAIPAACCMRIAFHANHTDGMVHTAFVRTREFKSEVQRIILVE